MKKFTEWFTERFGGLERQNQIYVIQSSHFSYYSGGDDDMVAFFDPNAAKEALMKIFRNERNYSIKPVTVDGPVTNKVFVRREESNYDPQIGEIGKGGRGPKTYHATPPGVPLFVFHSVKDAQYGAELWNK